MYWTFFWTRWTKEYFLVGDVGTLTLYVGNEQVSLDLPNYFCRVPSEIEATKQAIQRSAEGYLYYE